MKAERKYIEVRREEKEETQKVRMQSVKLVSKNVGREERRHRWLAKHVPRKWKIKPSALKSEERKGSRAESDRLR